MLFLVVYLLLFLIVFLCINSIKKNECIFQLIRLTYLPLSLISFAFFLFWYFAGYQYVSQLPPDYYFLVIHFLFPLLSAVVSLIWWLDEKDTFSPLLLVGSNIYASYFGLKVMSLMFF